MRKRWRIALVIVSILLVAGAAGVQYLNQVILPTKARAWVESSFSQALGRTVTVGRVRIHLWRGIVLEQVTIAEDARYGKTPFLVLNQVSGRILYLPLLKDRQLIIPTLSLVRPHGRLIQDSQGIWNFQSINILKPAPQKAATGRFKVAVPKIVLSDGQIEMILQKSGPRISIRLEHLNAQLSLSVPTRLRLILTTQLASNPSSHFSFDGTYDLQNRQFHLQNQSAISLSTIREYLPPEIASSIALLEGDAALQMDLSGDSKGPFLVHGTLATKGLAWKLQHPDNSPGLQSHGDVRLRIEGQIPSLPIANPWSSLNGFLDLDRITLSPLPSVGELREMTGQLFLNREGIRTEQLSATLPSGEILTMKGSIVNDEGKTTSLQIKSTLSLEHLSALIPKGEEFLRTWKTAGQATIQATVEGHLQPTPSLQPVVLIALQKASFTPTRPGVEGHSVRSLEGLIRWQPDLLTVTELRGEFHQQPFQLEGSLVNFAQPEIDAQLSWGPLTSEIKLAIDRERVEVHNFSGRYGNATFRLFGDIQGWTNPLANLYGETKLKVEEMFTLFPNPPSWLQGFPAKGELSTQWLLQGPLSRPQEWDLDVKAKSPTFTFREVQMNQVALDCRYEQGQWTIKSAKAGVAEGIISATGRWSLADSKGPWTARITASHVEMASLARQMKWKTQNISGQLFIDYDGSGESSQLATYQGTGKIRIQGGQIVELPFFGPFADLLKIPTLRTISFNEAAGTFRIAQGTLQTEGVQVIAPQQATLTITGSGGFLQGEDSPIDWKVLPTLAPEFIPEESRSKVGRAIAKGASYLVGEVHITGTWKNPKKAFVPKPLTQILNEQLFNIQDLWKDLF